ncbi:MAG: glycosyltransferase family 39 protein [Planctomycetes bacterium]|nr:glycosyltransferase family 39 protein [Planctomycetota bacterium]
MPSTTTTTATGREPEPRSRTWLLLGLVVAAALLRLPLLDRSIWFDEACMSDQRIGTTAQWLATLYVDIHPPLFVTFMHFWNGWFGDGEIMMRLPALLSGLACLPLTFWTGRRLVGEHAALFAAALLALSPVHVWYCAEARLYTPMVMCTLFAFGCVDRLTDDALGRQRLLFWLHALNVAVMLALHYYLAVVVVALALVALLLTRGARALLLVHGVGTLLLGGYVFAKLQLGEFETSQDYLRALDVPELFEFVFGWAWTGNTMQATDNGLLQGLAVGFRWLGVALVTIGAFAVLRRARSQPRALLVPFGLLLLPCFLLVCVWIGYGRTYLERTLIPALPFVMLLAGAGLQACPRLLRPLLGGLTLGLAATALGTLYATFETSWTLYKPHPDWRCAAAYLGAEIDAGNGGAPVFTSMPNPRSLSYYDPRIQDAKNLEVALSPDEIAGKVERRLGATIGGIARELFTEFAEHNRALLAQAQLVIRRSAASPAELPLAAGFDGVFYLVRNEWHPHVSVDDTIERLIADAAVEVLHAERCTGVTVYKVRLVK